jgi:hypothetical protein
MRITIKQLKKLIRETVEDIDPMELEHQASNLPSEKEDLFQLYSDMYKEMYNIRPRWLRSDDTSEDELRATHFRFFVSGYPRAQSGLPKDSSTERPCPGIPLDNLSLIHI